MTRLARALCGALLASIAGPALLATSIIPISDKELYDRSQVIVHGIVLSSDVTVDGEGRPEMLTVIQPLEVLKGRLSGKLVLHQLGGRLPDGRFFKLWGAPEYAPGREVIVFAITRLQGEHQTAEMLLGKFEVQKDERGVAFAVPALESGHAEVTVHPRRNGSEASAPLSTDPARELSVMLRSLRSGARNFGASSAPQGQLSPVVHAVAGGRGIQPEWANIGGLWRYNNNATAVWTLQGTANITGGGAAEAQGAMNAWNNDPHSTINQSIGGGPNNMYLDDLTLNGCGWTTCLAGGGVIGCGGPIGGGSNTWRGETYNTITGGHVWLRSYCSFNGFGSVTTQAVLTHELGHSLGLGHSDQAASAHDTCRGDEGAAQMRSVVQGYIALGTDDQDAIRWLYGDGLTSCGAQPAPTVSSVTPNFGPTAGGTMVTVVGTNFVSGATVAFGAGSVASTFVNATTLKATAPAGSGTVGVTVTNPDAQLGTLPSAYTYTNSVGYHTVTPCRVIDTRNANGPLGGPALAAGADRTFVFASQCGIPPGAKGVSLNVAVTQPTTGPSFLTLYPVGAPMPAASTINYKSGQTRSNNVNTLLGVNTDLIIHNGQSSGTVHVVVDVNGYFQ